MTKLDLVDEIEERLGIASTNLHKADKFTLEAILTALEPKSRRVPIVIVRTRGGIPAVECDQSIRVIYADYDLDGNETSFHIGRDEDEIACTVDVSDLDGDQMVLNVAHAAKILTDGMDLADHPDNGKRWA